MVCPCVSHVVQEDDRAASPQMIVRAPISAKKARKRGVSNTLFYFFALCRYEKGTCHTFAQIMFCPADVKHTVTYLLQYLFKQVKTRLIFFKGLAQQKVAPTSWESCTILHYFTNRFGGRGSNSWTTSLTTYIAIFDMVFWILCRLWQVIIGSSQEERWPPVPPLYAYLLVMWVAEAPYHGPIPLVREAFCGTECLGCSWTEATCISLTLPLHCHARNESRCLGSTTLVLVSQMHWRCCCFWFSWCFVFLIYNLEHVFFFGGGVSLQHVTTAHIDV